MKENFAAASASRWLASLALAAGAGLADPARACPPEDSTEESDSVRWRAIPSQGAAMGLLTYLGEPESNSQCVVEMSQSHDGDEASVRLENGKLTATLNGKAVPDDRVVRDHDSVQILDDKKVVLFNFTLPRFDGSNTPFSTLYVKPRILGSDGGLTFEPIPDDMFVQVEDNPPPVMLGITMSSEDGVDGVVVDSVLEGFPAAKAGVQVGDRILEIDGNTLDSTGAMREQLRDHKAGDKVVLHIQRDGEDKKITVSLDAYNAERLAPLLEKARAAAEARMAGAEDGQNAWYKDAQRAIETANKALADSKISDEARRNAQATLEKAAESLKEAQARARAGQVAVQGRALAQGWQGNRLIEPGKPQVFVQPTPTAPRAERNESRAAGDARLEARLEALSDRLDRMMPALEQQRRDLRESESRAADLRKENSELKDRLRDLQRKIEELEKHRGGN